MITEPIEILTIVYFLAISGSTGRVPAKAYPIIQKMADNYIIVNCRFVAKKKNGLIYLRT
ncbi:MAG: hypothetical protein ACLULH_04250 [Bacteroides fragilis]